MNQKDLKIIAHLRRNARIPLTNMSKKTRIPVSTIFDRMKMHENNIIKKHTCLLDFEKMGFHTRANINISVHKDDKDELKEFLIRNAVVNSLYKINNGYDFMIECVFKNLKDLEEFIELIESSYEIFEKQVYYIIEEIKKEEFMADPMMAGIIPN